VALNNRGVSFAYLLKRTQDFAASVEHKRKTAAWKFVPYPATWFNRDGWDDEIEAIVVTTQPGHDPKVQAEWEEANRRQQEAARAWWHKLTRDNRAIYRGGEFLNEQHEFETALREFDRAGRPGFKE
jgi:hypothetical protein